MERTGFRSFTQLQQFSPTQIELAHQIETKEGSLVDGILFSSSDFIVRTSSSDCDFLLAVANTVSLLNPKPQVHQKVFF